MKKLNLLKSLIMVIAVLIGTVDKAFCEATAVQASYTLVRSTVAVEKTASSESGSIDPSLEGKATTLTSSFNLKANDEKTFFVVYSRIQVDGGGNVSAFDQSGNLIFGNTTHLPQVSDVEKARTGTVGNANVIAYPFKLTGENINTSYTSSEDYKECYKVTLQDPLTVGILNQSVGGMPVANTFSTRDEKGTYSATVYITTATEL